jgi:hypothetical protein
MTPIGGIEPGQDRVGALDQHADAGRVGRPGPEGKGVADRGEKRMIDRLVGLGLDRDLDRGRGGENRVERLEQPGTQTR